MVLGFPCNQFASQEPDANSAIEASMRAKYNVTFPLFAKLNVNGPCTESDPNACTPASTVCCPANNPIYAYLKSVLPGPIAWNFAKFLIDRKGNPVQRYAPETQPIDIVADIKKLLSE
eukprot:m.228877 g.228877  ORF g.228877 m.228877 type:complete len:118 (-) comp11803_c0_seq1:156-509(-)